MFIVKGINSRVIRTASSSIPSPAWPWANCYFIVSSSAKWKGGQEPPHRVVGRTKTVDKNRLAQFLVLSKCCHFEMKNRHVWGKYHLSPKTGSDREGLQISLGADLDIWLTTLGQPTLNTHHTSYTWATSLL